MIKNKNIKMFIQNRDRIRKQDKMRASYLINKKSRIYINKAHKDTRVIISKRKRNMRAEEIYIKKKKKGIQPNEDQSIEMKVDKKQTISNIGRKEMKENIEIMSIMIDRIKDMTTEKVELLIEI